MQLKIVGKLFSIRGSSNVVDENNNVHYIIKGKLFSPTHKKYVIDENDNIIYTIRNKFFNLFIRKAYIYDKDENKIAVIKKKFIINKFILEGYFDEIKIDGDLIAWQFNIVKNNKIIGHIERKIISLTDTYLLDFENEEDAPFLVAVIGCIDNIYDQQRNSN